MTNYPQALDEWEQYMIEEGCDPLWVRDCSRQLGEALAGAGQRGYWLKLIGMTNDLDHDDSRTAYRRAELYARLGDREKALDWLDRAVAEHDTVENLLADEFWDDFHREPRFKKVLNKVGLAKWAR
jgi:tetratricopeptide (TPR) repeat protein